MVSETNGYKFRRARENETYLYTHGREEETNVRNEHGWKSIFSPLDQQTKLNVEQNKAIIFDNSNDYL